MRRREIKPITFNVERSLLFLLAKAHQHVVSLCKEELSEYEITPSQFILLANLWKMDSASQAKLSKKTQIDPSTIAGVIDRLTEKRLVERQPSPEDRRAHQVILTERGKELEKELGIAAHKVREKIKSEIHPNDIKILGRLLKRLNR